jgi:hypothetical protein
MKESAFFLRRIMDHTQYLQKINATLRGNSDFEGTSACDCKLGSWLCDTGLADITEYGEQHVEIFNTLCLEHEKFHIFSHEAVNSYKVGDKVTEARAFTEMHTLSSKLIALLLELDALTMPSKKVA